MIHKFEDYPELSEMMQEYAAFGSFSDWQKFTDALNNALTNAILDIKYQRIKELEDNEQAFRNFIRSKHLSSEWDVFFKEYKSV